MKRGLDQITTIGILGGGQLGRMSILAGRRLGFRFAVLEPKSLSSAGMVADISIERDYADPSGLERLASEVDVVTLEFENIPHAAIQRLETRLPVRPGSESLLIAQNRQREKNFLKRHRFPCADFRIVQNAAGLEEGIRELGLPCVLKTADFGYDGKGQLKIETDSTVKDTWAAFGKDTAVLEKWIRLDAEASVIVARSVDGKTRPFPLFRNEHRNHILHASLWPAGFSPEEEREAVEIARAIADELDTVGLLTVEFFYGNGKWLVNELAPRPHNSGHLTLDAAEASQFEQHIRAVAGLPLAEPRPTAGAACMINLLGDSWLVPKPDFLPILSHPRCKLHLYDKGEPKPCRKMGHFTLLGEDPEEVRLAAEDIWLQLNSTD